MNAGDLFDKLKHEAKALMGEESKDKYFPEEQEFADEAAAGKEFPNAIKRLFSIAKWQEESGIQTGFELYNQQLQKTDEDPKVGYFIKVILPGLPLENWVEITEVIRNENLVSFTVHPCSNPQTNDTKTEHFFVKEASSTFQVALQGNKIIACEIGKDETINNQEEAGNRSAINTLIAEGGWNGLQKIQWGNLAEYWCGKKHADNV